MKRCKSGWKWFNTFKSISFSTNAIDLVVNCGLVTLLRVSPRYLKRTAPHLKPTPCSLPCLNISLCQEKVQCCSLISHYEKTHCSHILSGWCLEIIKNTNPATTNNWKTQASMQNLWGGELKYLRFHELSEESTRQDTNKLLRFCKLKKKKSSPTLLKLLKKGYCSPRSMNSNKLSSLSNS